MNIYWLETIARMRRHLESRWQHCLQLFEHMVRINSFTGNAAGVDELGDYTASVFAELGFTAERVRSLNPSAGSHLLLKRGDASSSAVGCVSHLDTVFTEEEERRNNFRWSIDGGRVYGPGTNDVKGGTVIMYMMLDAIASVAPELFERVRWELLFDAAEEAESDDFGSLCVNRLGGRALACLVFEGGERDKNGYSIVTSRKGRAVFRVTTRGRSAHAWVDHQSGASAITQMADVVREISGFTDYEKEITFNVGTVTGGTVLNRVPHECTAEVEMRAFSPDALAEGVARIRSLDGFSSVTSGDGRYRCSTSVELLRDNPAWPRNPATEGLFRFWMDAAGMLGTRVKSEARGGISDGNHTWDHVPTIDGLGPSGDNAHCSERLANGSKSQEYAILPSFIPKALLNAAAVSLMIRESLQR